MSGDARYPVHDVSTWTRFGDETMGTKAKFWCHDEHGRDWLFKFARPDAAHFIASFERKHWPHDVPLPAIHYDPETRKHGPKRATLHAKCVVVDRRWAFVTSANFTEAAQERNIEAGVLLEHPRLAQSLAGQFEALKASGRLKKMAPR
jgi:phosphatidylserine/phosphatidylglycerophosphate/cardiolipin synthase-like enzyme